MRKAFSLILSLLVIAALWCSLFSCTSLQGEIAPPLVGGTQVSNGLILADSTPPQTEWRLLAFFSPT